MIEVTLLKRNRRGQYANGCTNADTFWFALFRDAPEGERLPLKYPPAGYYTTEHDAPTLTPAAAKRRLKQPAADAAALADRPSTPPAADVTPSALEATTTTR